MLPKAIPKKSINAKIETATVSALYTYFSTLNPSGTFDIQNYDEDRHNSMGTLGIKFDSIDDVKLVLDFLLENITLPTHPLRQNLEQKEREEVHEFILNDILYGDIDVIERPMGEFVEGYVTYMENYIEAWNCFRDEGVIGDAGQLDNKPEIMLQREKQEKMVENAGNDLNEERPENRTWVNSVMAYLHN
jgi:hypothetical protein